MRLPGLDFPLAGGKFSHEFLAAFFFGNFDAISLLKNDSRFRVRAKFSNPSYAARKPMSFTLRVDQHEFRVLRSLDPHHPRWDFVRAAHGNEKPYFILIAS